MATVKTRILVISDTHNAPLHGSDHERAYREGLPKVDLVLHCGDMTEEGHLHEYENTLTMLSKIDAEMKLVIAGNHDISLDWDYYESMGKEVHKELHDDDLTRKALRLMNGRKAMQAGVTYLQEGTHSFRLSNGAKFTVWATPYQPAFCNWAFAYNGDQDRFNPTGHTTKYAEPIAQNPIPSSPNVDIMMTHGPPLGHLDRMPNGAYLGCRHLQRAAARVKPRLHCFGHIHEGRGAERVTWTSIQPDYDTEKSVASQEAIDGKDTILEGQIQPSHVDVSKSSSKPLQFGNETLMINASIMDGNNHPNFAPWVVELELPLYED